MALTADRPRSQGLRSRPRASPRSKGRRSISSSPSIRSFTPTARRAFDRSSSAWARHSWPHSALGSRCSHSGPDLLNKPIRDPKQLYDFVFAIPPDTGEAGRRVSVLDAVAEDTKRLMTKLGTRDRQRIDEHLTHINAMEQRLRKGQGGCTVPPAPAPFPARPFGADTGGADYKGEVYNMDKLDAMTDVLVAALRCDLTRVFTILFTPPGSLITMNAAGEVNGPGSHSNARRRSRQQSRHSDGVDALPHDCVRQAPRQARRGDRRQRADAARQLVHLRDVRVRRGLPPRHAGDAGHSRWQGGRRARHRLAHSRSEEATSAGRTTRSCAPWASTCRATASVAPRPPRLCRFSRCDWGPP